MKKKIIAIFLASLIIASPILALNIPESRGFVNDFANVIDDEIEHQIDRRLMEYERKTSNEITVVTITSLEGESIEGFTMRLAEDWKVGQKDKDNGIILLFAIQEKKVRLEVGYGLEGIMNDAKAGRTLDDFVVEYRDEGNYTEAAKNGVEGIIQILGDDEWSEEMEGGELNPSWVFLIIVIFFIFFVALASGGRGTYIGGSKSSGGVGGFSGGSFGGGGASR